MEGSRHWTWCHQWHGTYRVWPACSTITTGWQSWNTDNEKTCVFFNIIWEAIVYSFYPIPFYCLFTQWIERMNMNITAKWSNIADLCLLQCYDKWLKLNAMSNTGDWYWTSPAYFLSTSMFNYTYIQFFSCCQSIEYKLNSTLGLKTPV